MDRQYPIGRFEFSAAPTQEHHTQWIAELATVLDQSKATIAEIEAELVLVAANRVLIERTEEKNQAAISQVLEKKGAEG